LHLELYHPQLRNFWDRLREDVAVIKPTKAVQPDGLSLKLLPFQLEGLDWMRKQEAGDWKGGILADEMGMGKTIRTSSSPLACAFWMDALADPRV
jgi:DNA repair protein RAD16